MDESIKNHRYQAKESVFFVFLHDKTVLMRPLIVFLLSVLTLLSCGNTHNNKSLKVVNLNCSMPTILPLSILKIM